MTVVVKMSTVENSSKTIPELREILERQEKLISNKKFIDKLPDKGEKIKKYREKLLKYISERDHIEQSCHLLSALSIQPSKTEIQDIEWQKNKNTRENECLDSDDDSEPEDPIAIIAGKIDTTKKIIQLKPEQKLITDEDIKEIQDFSKSKSELDIDKHTKYICEKTSKSNLTVKESFKPHKSSISNVHDPSKEIHRKKNKHWEITAATPPPIIHGPVQEISIQESLNLQSIQNQHLREIQIKQASERLALQFNSEIDQRLLKSLAEKTYRETTEIDDNSDQEEIVEVYDDEPKDGGVVFTIVE